MVPGRSAWLWPLSNPVLVLSTRLEPRGYPACGPKFQGEDALLLYGITSHMANGRIVCSHAIAKRSCRRLSTQLRQRPPRAALSMKCGRTCLRRGSRPAVAYHRLFQNCSACAESPDPEYEQPARLNPPNESFQVPRKRASGRGSVFHSGSVSWRTMRWVSMLTRRTLAKSLSG